MPMDDRPIKDVHFYLLNLDDSYGQVWSWFNSQLTINIHESNFVGKVNITNLPAKMNSRALDHQTSTILISISPSRVLNGHRTSTFFISIFLLRSKA